MEGSPECDSPVEGVVGGVYVSSGLVGLHLESMLGVSCMLSLELADSGRSSPSKVSQGPGYQSTRIQKMKEMVHIVLDP